MILSDRAEEILEALWIELVEHKRASCDASILKDDEAIQELTDLGYIKSDGGRIDLTNRGSQEARRCVRRHRLAERLMVDVLDIKKRLVHETSCRFEHLLHEGIDENICTLLGHPKTCPHGRPIPEGECCKEARRFLKKLIMPLDELEKNKRAKVLYLQTHDRKALHKIMAMGILPNTEITLIQKFPSYVLQIGKSQFAVDKELASQIYVRVG